MSDSSVVTLREVRRRRRQLYLRVAIVVVCLIVAAGCAFAWRFHQRMKASLPQLDGAAPLAGLSADATVTRDALGVPSIAAATRADAARALGFLHAQDRFFQMDLTRRRAAGELSELFGGKTLAADKAARIHGLRAIAQKSLALLPDTQRALLDAYTAGVNAGLAQLREPPFEYLLLGEKPRPWLPEDSILVIHAMAMDMQHPDGVYESTLGMIRDWYDGKVLAYFAPVMAPDDSALDGTSAPLPPIPGPSSINLRAKLALGRANPPGEPLRFAAHPEGSPYRHAAMAAPILAEGSNSMAYGRAHGAGIIENDMHLSLRVPGTWYRVSMTWNAPASSTASSDVSGHSALRIPHSTFTITGITHPGAPAIVAGSNGKIAWGFTNAFADTSDLIMLTPDPAIPESYYTKPGNIERIQRRVEKIHVRGKKEPVDFEVETTVWGPVIGTNLKGLKLALKWVFDDPAAANYDLIELETAGSVPAAIEIANRAGIPAQNMLVADVEGRIGWTICGRLPDRFGYDGRLPATWSFGDRGWRGLLPPGKTPAVIRGPSGHLSTANQRLFGGDTLAVLGDGGYRPGARGARMEALLARLDKNNAAPRDLLAIALDDRAPHLARWHGLLRDTLAASPKFARLRAAAGETWDENTGRASTDSAAYAVVRQFRKHVLARVLAPVFEPCADQYPQFNYNRLHVEEPVWNILRQKPAHLLVPEYASWDDLLLAAADDTRRTLSDAGFSNPAGARWGAFNVSRIRHPLSGGFMGLPGRLLRLDMPAMELPGDDDMPLVQYPAYGASMRMIVLPGAEEHGIFHMPCGQSGHPLSPYYRAGHDDWARGRPSPFLPGGAMHTLVLKAGP